MQYGHKHSFQTLCASPEKKSNFLPYFFRVDDDITVPDSTTTWDRRTERGTHYSVSQHHIVRLTTERSKANKPTQNPTHYNVSPSKDKQEQETRACKFSMCCSFFQLLNWKFVFRSFLHLCAGSRATCDSRATHFLTLRRLVCWTHTVFFLFGVVMSRWVLKVHCGHGRIFSLKNGNHPVKIPVALFDNFHR